MTFFEKQEGRIFFIPLFLPGDIRDNKKDYAKYVFAQDSNYAFGRLIQDDKSSGDLVEVFNYTGAVPADDDVIINSGVMASPFHVAMAFGTHRWRFVFDNKSYDKNADSNYADLTFLLGTEDDYELWRGGKKSRISNMEAKQYKSWVVHHPTRVEEAIRNKDMSVVA